MPARTGAQFLRGLRGSRAVWIGADRVADPLDHPELRGAAEAIAAVFDLHHEHPEDCLMPDAETCCAATGRCGAWRNSPSG
jgi:4-hydroxyphenylacetate 3-monooxygenase